MIVVYYNIDVIVVFLYICENGECISSFIICEVLEFGDIEKLNCLLGCFYSLIG